MKRRNAESLLKGLSDIELDRIADRISYLRSSVLHLTQSDFAAICNISQTYLSLIENHKKPVTIDTLHNIATGYMVNLEWLVYGDDNEQIFMSNKVNAEYLSKTHKDEALSTLRSAYSLSAEDIAFIHSFANLSQNERKHLISAIEALKSL